MRARGEDPMSNLERSIKADNEVIAGFPGVTFGIHICRGNRQSMWHREGHYDAIAEKLLRLEPEVAAAVRDETIELDEAAVVPHVDRVGDPHRVAAIARLRRGVGADLAEVAAPVLEAGELLRLVPHVERRARVRGQPDR